MTEQVLCRLSDLDATGTKEIVLDRDGGRYPVFVIRYADRILGYENSCQHVRLPLNWKDDIFFDISGTRLFCANNGAIFEPATGLCTRGPCTGQRLKSFPVRVVGENIISEQEL